MKFNLREGTNLGVNPDETVEVDFPEGYTVRLAALPILHLRSWEIRSVQVLLYGTQVAQYDGVIERGPRFGHPAEGLAPHALEFSTPSCTSQDFVELWGGAIRYIKRLYRRNKKHPGDTQTCYAINNAMTVVTCCERDYKLFRQSVEREVLRERHV